MKLKRIDKINSPLSFMTTFFIFALYLAAAETFLNIAVFSGAANEADYYASLAFSHDDWQTAKQFRKDLSSLGERRVPISGTLVYTYKTAETQSFSLNSLGFRGAEVGAKKEGEYRIAIFGDSRIFGVLLADKDTIPVIVERKLNEHYKTDRFRVLNVGFEGYDFQRTAAAADYYAPMLKPDLAVLYSGVNDINSAYTFGDTEWEPFIENAVLPPAFGDDPKDSIQKKSKLLNTLKMTFINDVSNGIKQQQEILQYPIPEDKTRYAEQFPDVFLARVGKSHHSLAEKGIPSIFILSSLAQLKEPLTEIEKHLLDRHEAYSPGLTLFAKTCYGGVTKKLHEEKFDFTIADHSRIFGGNDSTIFYDGVHFTPEGSRIAAEKIFEAIVRILDEKQ